MFEVWLHVERDAVEAHPFAQAHADGGDLVLAAPAWTFALHPHANASVAHFAFHVEAIERADDPTFKIGDEFGHVAAALAQIEHHVRHTLTRAVIRELAAAAGLEDREAI